VQRLETSNFSYPPGSDHKRGLGLESQEASYVAGFTQADPERAVRCDLRNALISIVQAKAVHGVAQRNLAYYGRVLDVSTEQFKAGDMSQIDLTPLQIQQVQHEFDSQNAVLNRPTAKLGLRMRLNAYQHGGASLLDLIGSCLVAAGQLELSVGREVIP
jgi:hypothetical protein